MYFLALAADYDGTIAEHGVVAIETVEALRSLKASGRKLILVTGRDFPDLKRVFADLELFDRIVAENGALLVNPATQEERVLGEPPSLRFVEYLQERKVTP